MKNIKFIILFVIILLSFIFFYSGIASLLYGDIIDSDGDGYLDNTDDFPYDPDHHLDTDKDGVPDDDYSEQLIQNSRLYKETSSKKEVEDIRIAKVRREGVIYPVSYSYSVEQSLYPDEDDLKIMSGEKIHPSYGHFSKTIHNIFPEDKIFEIQGILLDRGNVVWHKTVSHSI